MKLVMTSMREPAHPNAVCVSVRRYWDTAVKPSDFSMENFVIDKNYDNLDPFLDKMDYLLEGVVGSTT